MVFQKIQYTLNLQTVFCGALRKNATTHFNGTTYFIAIVESTVSKAFSVLENFCYLLVLVYQYQRFVNVFKIVDKEET